MIIIKNENPVPIDVDDTLVIWPEDPFMPRKLKDGYMEFEQYGRKVYLKPHEKNIQLLKNFKSRGYYVTVWSANGHSWVEEVVNKLLLSQYVDVGMTKPSCYVDDLDANEWMHRVYINEVGINE